MDKKLQIINPIASKHKTASLYCVIEKGCKTQCKIGVTVDPVKRIASLQAGNKRKLSFAWLIEGIIRSDCFDTERYLLDRFGFYFYGHSKRKQLESEWVDATPSEARYVADYYLDILIEEAS